jgi:subtilase family serine protease
VRLLAMFAVAALALLAIAVGAAATSHASARHGSMTPTIGGHPKFTLIDRLDGSQAQPGPLRSCQLAGTCYGPDQIRNAYGFQPLLDRGLTGAGRTIVIIDAYGSDTIQSDLDAFDAYFGVAPTTVDQIFPDGPPSPTSVENRFGWKGETTLDVEWAHAIAPGATIDLVVAKSNDDADILSATQYVADHNLGDVVSQSFGEAEQCMDPALLRAQHALFQRMTAQRITLLASSGDSGAAQPGCNPGQPAFKAASTPASDPNVTGVGGTDLTATRPTGDATQHEVTPGGQYVSETVWNEGAGRAGGGGISVVYPRPIYQALAVRDSRMREVPDVAYSASAAHAVLAVLTLDPDEAVLFGVPPGTFFFGFSGTSVGSPNWAGLIALSDQLAHGRVGFINTELYILGATHFGSSFFHDITTGDNSVPADPSFPGSPIPGFAAKPGYDAVTGLGSPKANALVPALVVSALAQR